MITLREASEICRKHGFGSMLTLPHANAKLIKSKDYYNAGVSLAQAKKSGFNVCGSSTVQCRNACIGGTGRAEFTPAIEVWRIARTQFLLGNLVDAWNVLHAEMCKVDRKAERLGIPVAFRPNILSDLPWHRLFPQMFTEFGHWQFYGYTKVRSIVADSIAGTLPKNFHVTYSWSEVASLEYVGFCIDNGINVAVPFYCKETYKPTIPEEWNGWEVINGDESDLRFLDPPNVIVGLAAKLPKKRAAAIQKIKDSDGFFVGV